jgi:DNA (cytosine-5)-methyltransferase 1
LAYYNEIDENAAAWLNELIAGGHLPDGYVDTRSIWDVAPEDLDGFTQHHFFAGIGGWPHALRLAGWPDDRPVWTGSCPCQPFSSAGEGGGFDDERHLWPAWHHLIRVCKPDTVFGEQVENAVNHGWLDLVHDDLEGEGYAVAAVGLPAASVGAPHIRQRLWFVADRNGSRFGLCIIGELGDNNNNNTGLEGRLSSKSARQLPVRSSSVVDRVGDPHGSGEQSLLQRLQLRWLEENRFENLGASPLGGLWSNAEWLGCADNKLRPVEPGTFPLAHGVSARVGRLRGYGNAIVPQVAAEVIKAYMSLDR